MQFKTNVVFVFSDNRGPGGTGEESGDRDRRENQLPHRPNQRRPQPQGQNKGNFINLVNSTKSFFTFTALRRSPRLADPKLFHFDADFGKNVAK